jgi:hypothetical protein
VEDKMKKKDTSIVWLKPEETHQPGTYLMTHHGSLNLKTIVLKKSKHYPGKLVEIIEGTESSPIHEWYHQVRFAGPISVP